MESRYLKWGAISLLAAWGLLILIGMTGYLRWDNRLLWVPPALMVLSLVLAAIGWEYDDRRAPLVAIAAAAIASFIAYAIGYVFLFLYSIPNRPI